MSAESIEDFLKGHAFFEDMTEGMIDYLAGCGQNKHFKPGEVICREGEPADEFYVIRKGRMAVRLNHPIKGKITIKTLLPGEMGVFSWIIPPYITQFDLEAVEHTSVVALDGKCVRKKCEEDCHLGYHLMKRAAAEMNVRLMNTRLQLLDVYGTRV